MNQDCEITIHKVENGFIVMPAYKDNMPFIFEACTVFESIETLLEFIKSHYKPIYENLGDFLEDMKGGTRTRKINPVKSTRHIKL